MKSYNNITLVGRAVKDSAIKDSPSGNDRGVFTIAVDRPYKNAEGKHPTDFFNIVVWGKLAQIVAEYVKKGALVLVSGRLQNRSYEANGETRWITEIVGDSVNILDYAKKETSKEEVDAIVNNDNDDYQDVPF